MLRQGELASTAFDRLRGRKIPSLPQPTSTAFSWELWDEIVQDPLSTARDLELSTAAFFFGNEIKTLRKYMLGDTFRDLSRSAVIQLALARSNRGYTIVRARLERAIKDGHDDKVIDFREYARTGGSRMQPNMSADDVVTSIVDSLPHWFAQASTVPVDYISDFSRILAVGTKAEAALSIEHGLRNLWQAVLWEGSRLAKHGSDLVLVPNDFHEASIWAAWEFRQEALYAQEQMLKTAERRGGSGVEIKGVLDRTVIALKPSNSTVRCKIGTPGQASMLRQEFVFDTLENCYLNIFLDQPLSDVLTGVTPRLMSKAICVIQDICSLAVAALPRSELKTRRVVEAYSLDFPRSTFHVAIRDSLGLDDETVSDILDRLICDPSDIGRAFREGVWHRPLVMNPESNRLLIIAGALLSGSPVRRMERWLQDGGLADNLSKSSRGLLFEEEIRSTIKKVASENPLLEDVVVSAHAIKKNVSGEEIDFIARIGHTVLVGEIKCLIVPSEALERFNHIGKLESAGEQAKRKARWLANNEEILQGSIGKLPCSVTGLQFVPMVILNQGIGIGLNLGETIVTDFHFLKTYLTDGSYVQSSIIGPNGEFIARYQGLYRSQSEAVSNFIPTFEAPPGFTKFLKAVKWRNDDFPTSSGVLRVPTYELDESAMRTSHQQAVIDHLVAQSRGERSEPRRRQ